MVGLRAYIDQATEEQLDNKIDALRAVLNTVNGLSCNVRGTAESTLLSRIKSQRAADQ